MLTTHAKVNPMFIKYLGEKETILNNSKENIGGYFYKYQVRNYFLKLDTKRQTLKQKVRNYLV